MQFGLYVHIPFCRQKCLYCDFASFAGNAALMEPYIEALCEEMKEQGRRFAHDSVDTVYIGGGTPTALPDSLLFKTIQTLMQRFHIEKNLEFTVEANPGTVDFSVLRKLRALGVNRLSFGVQSFQDEILLRLGRLHTAAEAEKAVCEATRAGFDNISIDLMYGLPGQRCADLEASLCRAAKLPVRHISVYGLQVEEKTPLKRLLTKQALHLPTEAEEDQMYELMIQRLHEAGFQRYEISNFSLPGFESQHNLRYWRYRPYLGLGVAAHSFFAPKRFWNASFIPMYIRQMKRLKSAVEGEETLSSRVQMEEFCFLALRQSEGIETTAFEQRFSQAFSPLYGHIIGRLKAAGLIEERTGRICLTPRGMKFGNRVFAEFLLDEEENI